MVGQGFDALEEKFLVSFVEKFSDFSFLHFVFLCPFNFLEQFLVFLVLESLELEPPHELVPLAQHEGPSLGGEVNVLEPFLRGRVLDDFLGSGLVTGQVRVRSLLLS